MLNYVNIKVVRKNMKKITVIAVVSAAVVTTAGWMSPGWMAAAGL